MALAALGAKPGTLCVMPAWTFVASAQAATFAGLVPYFVDVDPDTRALEPAAMDRILATAPGQVGAVMPVMPFGRPIDVAGWDAFRSRSHLAVVIDAAAGFDALTPSHTPAVVSLHATKALGIGEGGFVLSLDHALVRSIHRRTNFGFDGARDAAVAGFNAKLSEYHAAVGHAALDEWPLARSEWLAVAKGYRDRLSDVPSAQLPRGFGEPWISSVCTVELPEAQVAEVEERLHQADVATRRWWSQGAHAHESTKHLPRTALPVTERLARLTVALPFHRDLEMSNVDRVVDCLRSQGGRT
jgi:dTDP-4-amino-4,6-dideoxygalactose transaminase